MQSFLWHKGVTRLCHPSAALGTSFAIGALAFSLRSHSFPWIRLARPRHRRRYVRVCPVHPSRAAPKRRATRYGLSANGRARANLKLHKLQVPCLGLCVFAFTSEYYKTHSYRCAFGPPWCYPLLHPCLLGVLRSSRPFQSRCAS